MRGIKKLYQKIYDKLKKSRRTRVIFAIGLILVIFLAYNICLYTVGVPILFPGDKFLKPKNVVLEFYYSEFAEYRYYLHSDKFLDSYKCIYDGKARTIYIAKRQKLTSKKYKQLSSMVSSIDEELKDMECTAYCNPECVEYLFYNGRKYDLYSYQATIEIYHPDKSELYDLIEDFRKEIFSTVCVKEKSIGSFIVWRKRDNKDDKYRLAIDFVGAYFSNNMYR